jgi:hypothetical protein
VKRCRTASDSQASGSPAGSANEQPRSSARPAFSVARTRSSAPAEGRVRDVAPISKTVNDRRSESMPRSGPRRAYRSASPRPYLTVVNVIVLHDHEAPHAPAPEPPAAAPWWRRCAWWLLTVIAAVLIGQLISPIGGELGNLAARELHGLFTHPRAHGVEHRPRACCRPSRSYGLDAVRSRQDYRRRQNARPGSEATSRPNMAIFEFRWVATRR